MTVVLWIALFVIEICAAVVTLSIGRAAGRPTLSPPPQGSDPRPPVRPVAGLTTQARAGRLMDPARRARLTQVDRRPGISGPEAS